VGPFRVQVTTVPNNATYVVTIAGEEISSPHKHFTDRRSAEEYVLKLEEDPSVEYADIYKMSGHVDARSAVEARKRGEGELIDRRASDGEVRRRVDRAGGLGKYLGLLPPNPQSKDASHGYRLWKRARREGNLP